MQYLVQHHFVPHGARLEPSRILRIEAHPRRDRQQAVGTDKGREPGTERAAHAVHGRELRPDDEVVHRQQRPRPGGEHHIRQIAEHHGLDARLRGEESGLQHLAPRPDELYGDIEKASSRVLR
jgi:hypothetical protein